MLPGPSFKLFRLAGFPVTAHWSLILGALLIAIPYGSLVGGLGLSVLLFGSVLLHELGHSIVARRRRVPIEGIELHLFGGVAKMTAPPRSPNDEIAIAIAGPLVSFALAALFIGGTLALGADAPQWMAWIGGVNLLLGMFNLLPALPMDGGRVFRALLAKRKGLVPGTRIAVKVSRFIAAGFVVAGILWNPWMLALAVLVWMLGSAELAQMRRHEILWQHGYTDEHFNPWSRYERAAQRSSGAHEPARPAAPASRALEPQVILPADGSPPLINTAAQSGPRVVFAQRYVRDPFGRWVVISQPVQRW